MCSLDKLVWYKYLQIPPLPINLFIYLFIHSFLRLCVIVRVAMLISWRAHLCLTKVTILSLLCMYIIYGNLSLTSVYYKFFKRISCHAVNYYHLFIIFFNYRFEIIWLYFSSIYPYSVPVFSDTDRKIIGSLTLDTTQTFSGQQHKIIK